MNQTDNYQQPPTAINDIRSLHYTMIQSHNIHLSRPSMHSKDDRNLPRDSHLPVAHPSYPVNYRDHPDDNPYPTDYYSYHDCSRSRPTYNYHPESNQRRYYNSPSSAYEVMRRRDLHFSGARNEDLNTFLARIENG